MGRVAQNYIFVHCINRFPNDKTTLYHGYVSVWGTEASNTHSFTFRYAIIFTN